MVAQFRFDLGLKVDIPNLDEVLPDFKDWLEPDELVVVTKDMSQDEKKLLAPFLDDYKWTQANLRIHPNTRDDHPWISHAFYLGHSLNGFAARHPISKKFYIGICAITPIVLTDLFFRAFARPDFLPQVGDASLEVENPRIKRLNPLDLPSGLPTDVHEKWNPAEYTPRCRTRAQAALDMTMHCMHFLYTHEIAHIRFGHVNYLNDESPRCLKESLYILGGASEMALLQQTLEMDADSYGAAWLTRKLLTAIRSGDIKNSPWNSFGGGLAQKLFCTHLAVYMMFRLMYPLNNTITDYDHTSHPHPVVRQQIIGGVVEKALLQQVNAANVDCAEYLTTRNEIVPAVERVLGSIIEGIPAYAAMTQNDGDAIQDRIDIYLACWGEHREQLQKHCFVKQL